MPELVQLVNTVNSRLLYQNLMKSIFIQQKNKEQAKIESEEEDFKLLGIFEMLWNVYKPGDKKKIKTSNDKMLGYAMTIKDEYLN